MLSLQTTHAGIQITEKGAIIPTDITVEHWKEVLGGLKQVKDIYRMALADLTKFGRNKWGEQVVKDTFVQLKFELGDSYNALAISSLSESPIIKGLSLDHQYILGREVEDEKKREEWASMVVENKLTPADLRLSIQHGKITRSRSKEHGVISMEAVVALFLRCRKNYDVRKMRKRDREELVKIVTPLREFIEELVES